MSDLSALTIGPGSALGAASLPGPQINGGALTLPTAPVAPAPTGITGAGPSSTAAPVVGAPDVSAMLAALHPAPVVPKITPTNFSIDTTAPVTSEALGNGKTSSDAIPYASDSYHNVLQGYDPTGNPIYASGVGTAPTPGSMPAYNSKAAVVNPYEKYAEQLASATQYSPDYIAALKAKQAADLATAQNTVDYSSATNYPGETTGQASVYNARTTSLNAINSMSASQQLQVQELIRQGNIAGAQALVDAYKPVSVSPGASLVTPVNGQEQYSGLGGYQAVQGIQTVANLAQQFPDAAINPTDTLQVAQQKAAASPSFSSKNLVQVTLPGGGIQFVNRNQLKTNADGSYTLVSSGAATTQSAASAAIKDLTTQKANMQAAISTADSNFPLLLQAVKGAGLNNNAPLINEISQRIANPLSKSTALAALNTLVPSLQSEYSRIIARGGTVDDKTRSSAQAIINGTYTLAQLQTVYNTVKAESGNVIKGFDDAIAQQAGLLGNAGTPSGAGGIPSWASF